MPPQYLPGFVQRISPYLPTRQFVDLLWSVIGSHSAARAMIGLAAYAVVFAVFASLGYRRDERTRYA
jgi:ABC-2 type transport system permease protein